MFTMIKDTTFCNMLLHIHEQKMRPNQHFNIQGTLQSVLRLGMLIALRNIV